TLLEESLAICREEGYAREASGVLCGLGDVPCKQGDYTGAMALYWEAIEVSQRLGDLMSMLWPLRNLGWLALIEGDDGRVLALLQAYIAWSRDKAALTGLAHILHILGALLNVQGDAAQAAALLHEGLMLQQRIEYMPDEILQVFAVVAAGQGRLIRAARLL